LSAIERLADEPDGRIVSVTSMTPTKFGEAIAIAIAGDASLAVAAIIAVSSSPHAGTAS
jgi:hypothetical protein